MCESLTTAIQLFRHFESHVYLPKIILKGRYYYVHGHMYTVRTYALLYVQRELPEPLIPNELLKEFVGLQQGECIHMFYIRNLGNLEIALHSLGNIENA